MARDEVVRFLQLPGDGRAFASGGRHADTCLVGVGGHDSTFPSLSTFW